MRSINSACSNVVCMEIKNIMGTISNSMYNIIILIKRYEINEFYFFILEIGKLVLLLNIYEFIIIISKRSIPVLNIAIELWF